MFLVFQILAFWREVDVTKFPPNFVFSIIGYLMMVSERTHHKDVKSEKFSNTPIHSKDIAFWKFNFPPFVTKNSTKWQEIQISKKFQIPILLKIFQWIALKLKKMTEGEHFWYHICPPWFQWKFVFHYFKAIFDTSFAPFRSFFS